MAMCTVLDKLRNEGLIINLFALNVLITEAIIVRTSSIPDEDKGEIEEELSKINKLAVRDPAPGLLERAKTRLDVVKLAMTGTDLAVKAAPHLETLWEFIGHKFGG